MSTRKPKHSPKPWTRDGGQIRDAEGNAIASVPHTLGDETDDANGRLMTAAPDLLHACRELLALVEDFMPSVGGIALQNYQRLNDAPLAGRAAIANATETE